MNAALFISLLPTKNFNFFIDFPLKKKTFFDATFHPFLVGKTRINPEENRVQNMLKKSLFFD